MSQPTCKLCDRATKSPTGLCQPCRILSYRGLGMLRVLIPITQDYPTDYPPGSLAKIEVLARRAGKYDTLFHPDDTIERIPQWQIADA